MVSKKLNLELSKYFKDFKKFLMKILIADTYYFEKNSDFEFFLKNFKINKKLLF